MFACWLLYVAVIYEFMLMFNPVLGFGLRFLGNYCFGLCFLGNSGLKAAVEGNDRSFCFVFVLRCLFDVSGTIAVNKNDIQIFLF